jgi:adenylosuccinate lyase
MTAFLGSVAETLGEESRFIHLGLTSSDIMDTALSLQLVEATNLIIEHLKGLVEVLAEKALSHKYTIMIGRTHGVHAEPITFGLKMALWLEEIQRNRRRLIEAAKTIRVGKISGAVGTYATLNPDIEEYACRKLGLTPEPVSNQVIQRDRHAQYLTTLAIISGSLEKFSTELRALQKTEVQETEEPFSFGQTGSSSMPHKRNPELCERITGIARVIRGYAFTSLENMALWHERDISHSSTERIILPDATTLLDYQLTVFTSVMNNLKVNSAKMKRNLTITKGLIFSQRVLIALIEKGLTRQKAYKLIQRNAMESWNKGKNFRNLLKSDPEVSAFLSEDELEKQFDLNFYLRYVDDIYERIGLTSAQWKNNPEKLRGKGLAPNSL